MSNVMKALNPPPDFTQRDFIVFGPVKAPRAGGDLLNPRYGIQ